MVKVSQKYEERICWKDQEANGCIFCGCNAEPLVCYWSYDVRDRE